MSKREKRFVVFYVVMLLIFFVSRLVNLGSYDSYDGKISHITGTSIPVIYDNGHGYRKSSGTNYYPYIEYYKDNDTINTTQKGWSPAFLDEGQKITVLANKSDDSDVMLLTLFNYWIPVYVIVFFLVFGFIGYRIVVSIDQREYLESQQFEGTNR